MTKNREKFNDDEVKEIINLYLNENTTIKFISNKFGCSEGKIYNVFKSRNLKKSLDQKRKLRGWRVFTSEEEQDIVKKYTGIGFNLRQLSEIYNCKPSLIVKTLWKYNVETRDIGGKINVNDDGSEYKFPRIEEKHPLWIGGRLVTDEGYIKIINPDRLTTNTRKKYILEHRCVMEKHIGRKLDVNEHVHHINGIKDDNRLENLVIKTSSNHYGEVVCPCCQHQFRIR